MEENRIRSRVTVIPTNLIITEIQNQFSTVKTTTKFLESYVASAEQVNERQTQPELKKDLMNPVNNIDEECIDIIPRQDEIDIQLEEVTPLEIYNKVTESTEVIERKSQIDSIVNEGKIQLNFQFRHDQREKKDINKIEAKNHLFLKTTEAKLIYKALGKTIEDLFLYDDLKSKMKKAGKTKSCMEKALNVLSRLQTKVATSVRVYQTEINNWEIIFLCENKLCAPTESDYKKDQQSI